MFYLLIALHIGNEKRGDLKDMNGSSSEACDYHVFDVFSSSSGFQNFHVALMQHACTVVRPYLDFRIFMLLSCSMRCSKRHLGLKQSTARPM